MNRTFLLFLFSPHNPSLLANTLWQFQTEQNNINPTKTIWSAPRQLRKLIKLFSSLFNQVMVHVVHNSIHIADCSATRIAPRLHPRTVSRAAFQLVAMKPIHRWSIQMETVILILPVSILMDHRTTEKVTTNLHFNIHQLLFWVRFNCRLAEAGKERGRHWSLKFDLSSVLL